MGKKQAKEKFDRNVEISAPILDPEIIKAIHGRKFGDLDMGNAGFKALLADLHSQDSEDVAPVVEQHVPSYIGISCAVSGYSNYSQYSSKAGSQLSTSSGVRPTARQSTRTSIKLTPTSQNFKEDQQINHITIDKENIQSPEQERKDLTDKLTASVADKRRSPSPCLPPGSEERHHGAYVGARYCPLPPPSQEVVKHIPLLGIDDEQDEEQALEEQAKIKGVENKIASIYGDEFVEDWKESMTHKAKKEIPQGENNTDSIAAKLQPKDLVTLKPTPVKEPELEPIVHVERPNIKVMENIEEPFLNKILTDDKPIFPREMTVKQSPQSEATKSPPQPTPSPIESKPETPEKLVRVKRIDPQPATIQQTPPQSPEKESVENSSSPDKLNEERLIECNEDILVNLNMSNGERCNKPSINVHEAPIDVQIQSESPITNSETTTSDKAGLKYLDLTENEIHNMKEKVAKAERLFDTDALGEEAAGNIRSAIGKANLLINDKFQQFKLLCNENINGSAQTLDDDLVGFWDMLSLQINEVNKNFEALFKASENNWQVDEEDNSPKNRPVGSGKQPGVTKPKLSSEKNNERHRKMVEHINQMKAAAFAENSQDAGEELLLGLTPEQQADPEHEVAATEQQQVGFEQQNTSDLLTSPDMSPSPVNLISIEDQSSSPLNADGLISPVNVDGFPSPVQSSELSSPVDVGGLSSPDEAGQS